LQIPREKRSWYLGSKERGGKSLMLNSGVSVLQEGTMTRSLRVRYLLITSLL